MKNYKLIPKITLWVLMALGIVFSIMFYLGGNEAEGLEVAGDMLNIPLFTNVFLSWNYILIALVCILTLAVVVWEFVKTYKVDKMKAFRSLAVVVVFVLIVLTCWWLGSADEVKIIGYEGTDNVGSMAKLSDACLYLTYILTAGTIVALVWGIIYTKNKK